MSVSASDLSDSARPGLSGLEPGELAAWLVERGEPAFRARQIEDALWRRHAASAAEVPSIPEALRPPLDAAFRFDTLEATDLRPSDGGLRARL